MDGKNFTSLRVLLAWCDIGAKRMVMRRARGRSELGSGGEIFFGYFAGEEDVRMQVLS
jgi:hypothetical protein